MKTALLLLLSVGAGALSAHDIATQVEFAPPAVILRTSYAAGEPTASADVVVYAPSSGDDEYQIGRTDSNGIFSFVPSEAGDWRVVVDDGMGHREETTVSVAADGLASTENPPARVPASWKLIMGLSVILGLTGFFYGYRSRRSKEWMAAR